LEKFQPQITVKAILCESLSHDESECGFVPKHHKHGYIQGLWRRSNTKELIGSKIGTFNLVAPVRDRANPACIAISFREEMK